MNNDSNLSQQDFIETPPGRKNVCYVLDEEAIEAMRNLMKKNKVNLGVTVKTKSDQRTYRDLDSFLEWANRPHSQIESIFFFSVEDEEAHSVYVRFGTDRLEPAVAWGLSGPESRIKSIEEGIKTIVQQTKRVYSAVYSGGLKSIALDVISVLCFVFFIGHAFPLIADKLYHADEFQIKRFRAPDGRVFERVPLQPIQEPSKFEFFDQFLPYAYILATAILLTRALKPLFPVGMFEFGFGSGNVKRRIALQKSIFWGGIISLIISMLSPLLSNHLPSIRW